MLSKTRRAILWRQNKNGDSVDKTNKTNRLLNLSGWIAGSAMAIYGLLFLFLAVRHIAYPSFTEPMEGDILQHIAHHPKII